jgi:hypothetical protein
MKDEGDCSGFYKDVAPSGAIACRCKPKFYTLTNGRSPSSGAASGTDTAASGFAGCGGSPSVAAPGDGRTPTVFPPSLTHCDSEEFQTDTLPKNSTSPPPSPRLRRAGRPSPPGEGETSAALAKDQRRDLPGAAEVRTLLRPGTGALRRCPCRH